VLVHGRAQEAKEIPPATANDSIWRNLLNTLKRIDADPLPHARVRVAIGGVEREIEADDEGFFRAWIDLPAPLPAGEPWQPVELRLLSRYGLTNPTCGRRARCSCRAARRRSG